MTDHSQLVKRLREHTQAFGTHYEQRQVDVCIEAADAIEALQARVEALEAGLRRDAVARLHSLVDWLNEDEDNPALLIAALPATDLAALRALLERKPS